MNKLHKLSFLFSERILTLVIENKLIFAFKFPFLQVNHQFYYCVSLWEITRIPSFPGSQSRGSKLYWGENWEAKVQSQGCLEIV